jgi:hypothetical protein
MFLINYVLSHIVVGIVTGIVYYCYQIYILNILCYTIIATTYSIVFYLFVSIMYGHLEKKNSQNKNTMDFVNLFLILTSLLVFLLLIISRYVTSVIISLCVTLFPELSFLSFLTNVVRNFL